MPSKPAIVIAERDGRLYAIPVDRQTAFRASENLAATSRTGNSNVHGVGARYNNGHGSGHKRIIDPSLVLPQALLGGQEGIQALHWLEPLLRPRHSPDSISSELEDSSGQASVILDDEIISKLWEGWVLDGTVRRKVVESEMQVLLSLQAAREDPENFLKHFHRAVEWHINQTKAQLIIMVLDAENALEVVESGRTTIPIVERMGTKKDTKETKGLKESVEEGEGWKLKGNVAGKKGKHEVAIRNYLNGLLALWPWTSGDIAMSFDSAASLGLVKLEQALLGNIAAIALTTPAKTGPKRIAFDTIARVACEVLLQLRYATNGTLYKAFDRLSQLDEREQGVEDTDGVNRLMAGLFKQKPAEQWAHRDCTREHVCHN